MQATSADQAPFDGIRGRASVRAAVRGATGSVAGSVSQSVAVSIQKCSKSKRECGGYWQPLGIGNLSRSLIRIPFDCERSAGMHACMHA